VTEELSDSQIAVLKRLRERGFGIVAFPMYANYIGVRKGTCGALLAPIPSGGMKIYGESCYLIGGNFSARVKQGGKEWFVWKKEKLEATSERSAELRQFEMELAESLLSTT
jgi:hypothetical protein